MYAQTTCLLWSSSMHAPTLEHDVQQVRPQRWNYAALQRSWLTGYGREKFIKDINIALNRDYAYSVSANLNNNATAALYYFEGVIREVALKHNCSNIESKQNSDEIKEAPKQRGVCLAKRREVKAKLYKTTDDLMDLKRVFLQTSSVADVCHEANNRRLKTTSHGLQMSFINLQRLQMMRHHHRHQSQVMISHIPTTTHYHLHLCLLKDTSYHLRLLHLDYPLKLYHQAPPTTVIDSLRRTWIMHCRFLHKGFAHSNKYMQNRHHQVELCQVPLHLLCRFLHRPSLLHVSCFHHHHCTGLQPRQA